jgi:hypothetical protein
MTTSEKIVARSVVIQLIIIGLITILNLNSKLILILECFFAIFFFWYVLERYDNAIADLKSEIEILKKVIEKNKE